MKLNLQLIGFPRKWLIPQEFIILCWLLDCGHVGRDGMLSGKWKSVFHKNMLFPASGVEGVGLGWWPHVSAEYLYSVMRLLRVTIQKSTVRAVASRKA